MEEFLNQIKEGEIGETPTPILDEEEKLEPEVEPVEEVQEKMLTQSQVNELVGRARQEGRESALKELFMRYGVGDDTELNDVFGRGQAYDDLNEEFNSTQNTYKDTVAENALLKSHIDETRWEDVKLILGGKGVDVNVENIESFLPSHPEWIAQQQQQSEPLIPLSPEMADEAVKRYTQTQVTAAQTQVPPATLRKLGNEAKPALPEMTDEERANKLFGFNK